MGEERVVYEVVVSTDDGYFTVIVTDSREDADALAAWGDTLLWDGPRDYLHFAVKEHPVKAVGDVTLWSRQDFIDALDHPEPEDWFAPEDTGADRG
ncbi:MAG: hypothetical protein FIA92_13520 [Chloroflexi bacterium]|nr:hypothetical protein [Chloroflexota bacterium]